MITHKKMQTSRSLLLVLFLACIFPITACVKLPVFRPDLTQNKHQEGESIFKEINRLEKELGKTGPYPAKPDIYLQLAYLYSHHNNPAPDYSQALKMLETFEALDPSQEISSEIPYLSSMLRKIVAVTDDNEKLKMKTLQIEQQQTMLFDSNEKLVAENKSLHDSIEKLKLLDMLIEEKRLETR